MIWMSRGEFPVPQQSGAGERSARAASFIQIITPTIQRESAVAHERQQRGHGHVLQHADVTDDADTRSPLRERL